MFFWILTILLINVKLRNHDTGIISKTEYADILEYLVKIGLKIDIYKQERLE